MTSVSETGHAKNVANFNELVMKCVGFGEAYTPSLEAISVSVMQAMGVKALDLIEQVKTALPLWSNAVAERDKAFETLNSIITRVLNALRASGVDQQILDNVRTLARKIRGMRAGRKLSAEEKKTLLEQGKDVNEISVSQMSFDNRIDNLSGLVHMLETISNYAPNEPDLKTSALKARLDDLRSKNTAAVNAAIPLNKARILRNQLLYNEKTGLIATAIMAKAYVRSVFGSSDPNFKSISKLSFRSVSLS